MSDFKNILIAFGLLIAVGIMVYLVFDMIWDWMFGRDD